MCAPPAPPTHSTFNFIFFLWFGSKIHTTAREDFWEARKEGIEEIFDKKKVSDKSMATKNLNKLI